ncbi:MAG: cysteine--tRNA ligase, partial [Clostridia bacterium]
HGEFMLVNNGKMSKSLGNTYRVSQLEEMGYCALDFRYFCLNAHYRKKLNFTFEGMDAAKVSYDRLLSVLFEHKMSDKKTLQATLDGYKNEFVEAINNDLNLPLALGVLWKMTKEEKSKDIFNLALEFDKTLGLSLDKARLSEVKNEETTDMIPQEIEELARQRVEAKKNKNYALSDELRNKIASAGFDILDTKDGFKLSKKI